MLFISTTALNHDADDGLLLARPSMRETKAIEPAQIEGFRGLVLWARCTSFGRLALRWICVYVIFSSCGAHALQTDDRHCPDGQTVNTFVESVGDAVDMDTVRYRFTKLFGPGTADQSRTTTASACWTLKTVAGFDHPLRAIALSLNDEMLEGERNHLKPKVRDNYCLVELVVTRNLKRLEEAAVLNAPTLKKSTFSLPSSTFNKLVVHELNGCLIRIELVAFQLNSRGCPMANDAMSNCPN